MKDPVKTEARKVGKDKRRLSPRLDKAGLSDVLVFGSGQKTIYGRAYHQKGDLSLPEGEEGQIAIWATMEKAGQEGMTEAAQLERMTALQMEWHNLPYPAPILMKALISGDHVLFRKISEAMAFLQKNDIHIRPGGVIEAEGLGNRTQSYIIANWERWKTSKAPVKERLDDLSKSGVATSRKTYYRIVEQSGLVSDEVPPV